MSSCRRRSLLAAAGCAAVLGSLAGPAPAQAATDPVNNDYGQSAEQVTAEVAAQVAATPAVKAANAKVAQARAALRKAKKLEAVARRTDTRVRAAHRRTVRAKAALAAARAAQAKVVTSATATVRAAHFTPVDGSYVGSVAQYFIPGIGLEPIQVGITVYGGHVSDVSVPLYVATGDSGEYNAMALPILMTEAMAAGDTATVASVTGASLTSGAFVSSLTAALAAAGFTG